MDEKKWMKKTYIVAYIIGIFLALGMIFKLIGWLEAFSIAVLFSVLAVVFKKGEKKK